MFNSETDSSGGLGLRVIRGGRVDRSPSDPWPTHALNLREIGLYGTPQPGLPDTVNAWRRANRPNLAKGARKILLARALKIPHFYGQLFLTVVRGDGTVEPLGLAGMRMVTTVGVKYVCDDFNAAAGSADVSNFKYHGFGTGALTEAVGNTALVTEEAGANYTGGTRPVGTQASATVTTNATYTTVATHSPVAGSSPRPITEHGIFSAATVGTLLDATSFSVVNLAINADSLQATYVFTLNSGG